MTIVLIGKGLILWGWPSKIEVIWVPGIYTHLSFHISVYIFTSLPDQLPNPSIPPSNQITTRPGPKAAVKGADKSSQIKTEVKGEGPILTTRTKIVQKETQGIMKTIGFP